MRNKLFSCQRSVLPRFRLSAILAVLTLSAVAIFGQDAAVGQTPVSDSPIDLSRYNRKSVYSNDFQKPQKIAFENDLIKQNAAGTWKRTANRDRVSCGPATMPLRAGVPAAGGSDRGPASTGARARLRARSTNWNARARKWPSGRTIVDFETRLVGHQPAECRIAGQNG